MGTTDNYLEINLPAGYVVAIGTNLSGHTLGPRHWIYGPDRKGAPPGWIRSLGLRAGGWEAWAGHSDALGWHASAQAAADAVVQRHMNAG